MLFSFKNLRISLDKHLDRIVLSIVAGPVQSSKEFWICFVYMRQLIPDHLLSDLTLGRFLVKRKTNFFGKGCLRVSSLQVCQDSSGWRFVQLKCTFTLSNFTQIQGSERRIMESKWGAYDPIYKGILPWHVIIWTNCGTWRTHMGSWFTKTLLL